MADKKPKQPELPDDAPADLKEFVDCKGSSLTIKKGKVGWVPGSPSIGFAPGPKPGTIKLTFGWGIVSASVVATVTKGGLLSVDTTGVPDLSSIVKGAGPKTIDKWVQDLNDWLRANGKKLGQPKLDEKKGEVVIAKEDRPAGAGGVAPGKAADPPPQKAGLKTKVAVGVGATLIGLGTGAIIGDQAGESSAPDSTGGQGDVVLVTPAENPPEQPPATEETVISLPAGPVNGEVSITGPNNFAAPIQFIQDGPDLTLILPGNPPFVGTIDDRARFAVENGDGSFEGRFTVDRFSAVHFFQGVRHLAEGMIDRPVVIEQTAAPGPETILQFADRFAAGFKLPPQADAPAGSDGNGLATGLGIGLIVLGTGLAGAGLANGRTCEKERAAVAERKAKLEEAQRKVEQADRAAERAKERRDAHRATAPKRPPKKPPEPTDQGPYPSIDFIEPVQLPPEPETESERLEREYDQAVDAAENADEAWVDAADNLLYALQDLAECEDRPLPDKLPHEYLPKKSMADEGEPEPPRPPAGYDDDKQVM